MANSCGTVDRDRLTLIVGVRCRYCVWLVGGGQQKVQDWSKKEKLHKQVHPAPLHKRVQPAHAECDAHKPRRRYDNQIRNPKHQGIPRGKG